RVRRLLCCGLGMGWLLFAVVFLLPFHGTLECFILIYVWSHDHKEKEGYA
ncbi:hypothetical protein CFC21_078912, partial [Triticum aestivum]